jgi:flagellar basal-body rod modification protein FlgD
MTTTTTPTSTTTTPSTTSPTSSTSSTSSTSNVAGAQQIAGDYNTFLTLLTTQLQNQDPLDPLDTNQFTQQLVDFASVEQQVNMNSNLQTLISLQQTNEATSAMQYLGSNVTVSGSGGTLSTSSPATWSLNSPSPATGNVTITSSTGQTAFTGTVALNSGSQTYSWNGQGNNGVTWPAGQYTLAVTATGANGQAVTVSTQTQGTVSGINLSQNPAQIIVGGQSYPISAIQSINSSSLSGDSGLSTLNSSIGTLNSNITTLSQLL